MYAHLTDNGSHSSNVDVLYVHSNYDYQWRKFILIANSMLKTLLSITGEPVQKAVICHPQIWRSGFLEWKMLSSQINSELENNFTQKSTIYNLLSIIMCYNSGQKSMAFIKQIHSTQSIYNNLEHGQTNVAF